MPVDRTTIPIEKLNVAYKTRTNPFPWVGQFQPQFVSEMLSEYSVESGAVLDPFVGSGTVLLEAARHNMSAYGTELNPAAIMFSNIYKLINLSPTSRRRAFSRWQNMLRKEMPTGLGYSKIQIMDALIKLWNGRNNSSCKILTSALITLCDFHKDDLSMEKVEKNVGRLESVVESLPSSKLPIVVKHADARRLPFQEDLVNLVITSPPYINVHNYHQNFRRSVESMGYDVLRMAKSEIGSNRQNRGNRFMTAIQYSIDMMLAMREMSRILNRDGRMILVVGRESLILGEKFFNSSLIAEIAVLSLGLGFLKRQERVFQNRYGKYIYEDILHFDPGTNHHNVERQMDDTMMVSCRNLEGVLAVSESERNRDLIRCALELAENIKPSPILDPSE